MLTSGTEWQLRQYHYTSTELLEIFTSYERLGRGRARLTSAASSSNGRRRIPTQALLAFGVYFGVFLPGQGGKPRLGGDGPQAEDRRGEGPVAGDRIARG